MAEPHQIYTDSNGVVKRVYARKSDDDRWWQETQDEFDIEELSAADQLKAKWHVPTLLPRSAAPPPDNRPSASWH